MSTKRILGLDLGTNSIGWALVENDTEAHQGQILDKGVRIIPMDKSTMGNFEAGNSISQTAERTHYRGVRRLYQRAALRRERLHRVLNVLGFLPEHYADSIDFEKRLGQFKKGQEVKLNYIPSSSGKDSFLFQSAYEEMVEDFKLSSPDLFHEKKNGHESKIPYDWTIYYLRKKGCVQKLSKQELAWLLLNFNQKRGYYQLRGEDQEEDKSKMEEFFSLEVVSVEETDDRNNRGVWYHVHLENGLIYRRQSKTPLHDWVGMTKEFIVTTNLEKDGSPKVDSEGNVSRSFRSVNSESDWIAIKKKTEQDIDQSGKTVGAYIYDRLLQDPKQKINGKLVRTIERKYYKDELKQIIETQVAYHEELRDRDRYYTCVKELYRRNEAHRNNILQKDDTDMFRYLFMDDIIFYQRPLKSKKSTISGCPYETRCFMKENTETGGQELVTRGVKVIAKSNPLYQEFRLWQFIHNLRVYMVEDTTDVDVTEELFTSEDDICDLYDFLNTKKEIDQKGLIKYLLQQKKIKKADKDNYQWNYLSDKPYPMNATLGEFLSRLGNIEDLDAPRFLTSDKVHKLWHLVYSVKDKEAFTKALNTFAKKNDLPVDAFVAAFKRMPSYDADYGAYSQKAIKKLLPLMRRGRYWSEQDISSEVMERVADIYERIGHLRQTGHAPLNEEQKEEAIKSVSDDALPKQLIRSFLNHPLDNPLTGLNTYQACYAVYERHSEGATITKWSSPADIDAYLSNFKQHSLRNPIVEQVVTETLRTVRDIWSHHLSLDPEFKIERIHLELGRDIKNSADKRKKISERQSENENTNRRIKLLLEELHAVGARSFSPSHQDILKLYEEGVAQNPEASYEALSQNDVEKIRRANSPTKSQITKYKLWLEQGYISPYTGEVISLSDLFTPKYEIEHIIPRSRYFDDSLSNKIICESAINPRPYKDNKTGMEFIQQMGGSEVPELSVGSKKVRLFTVEQYENHCRKYFRNNRKKLANLLSLDIPDGFINRQMNDSRYISKFVKGLLSNIVREPGEKEATSKNLIPIPGAITSRLKHDWGLHEQWNRIIQPRFERLNALTNSQDYGYMDTVKIDGKSTGTPFFRIVTPDGVNKKRIDHRHHTLDAIVLACCTRRHTQYLNSLSNDNVKHSLQPKLLIKNDQGHFTNHFIKPWSTFTTDVKKALDTTIVSFKKNTRVITKTNNKTWQWRQDKQGRWKKTLVAQTKGDSSAIRKALHKETIYGKVSIKRNIKTLGRLKSYILTPKLIRDRSIRREMIDLLNRFDGDKKKITAHLKDNPVLRDGHPVDKIGVWEWTNNATAARVALSEQLTQKQLDRITDSGIRRILENHLEHYTDGEGAKHFDQAFSPEGIARLNNNIVDLNNGKPHQPIRTVRIYEEGSRFAVSQDTGNVNKTKKYVEAAKGTNLFFAIYWDEEKQKRTYETIPLIDVIEHQKLRAKNKEYHLPMIPVNPDKGRFLFHLSPGDVVYVPTEEELSQLSTLSSNKVTKEKANRFYKMISSTGNQCFFLKSNIAGVIENKKEFSALNKMEKSLDGIMIKGVCQKIRISRISKITNVIK